MSITIRSKSRSEVSVTFREWRDEQQHDTVLLDNLAMIATIQVDDSICVISMHDEVTFTVYNNFNQLVNDLEIDDEDPVIAIASLDIAYDKLKE